METDLLSWMLIGLIAIELIAIVIISNAIKMFLKSKSFKQKLNRFHKIQKEAKNKVVPFLIFAIATQFSTTSFATSVVAETVDVAESVSPIQVDFTNQILVSISILLLIVILYLKRMMSKLFNIDKDEEELNDEKPSILANSSKLINLLTDRVAEEDEASIDMGHEYDGIRELDNNLPPWWKWGFYLSIAIGVVYFSHYHIFKTGTLPAEQYNNDLKQAELDVAQYLKDQAMNVDESSVTLMVESSDLNKGKDLFNNYCAVCHSDDGGGGVGPNLTDEFWLHGGGIKDVFKTIKYGAANGMKSWKDELNPIQIQQVSSYIKSIVGTTPANPKEPQGEKYVETEVSDEQEK